MKSFLMLPIFLFSLNAFAGSKWVFVGENANNDSFFVDINSYQKSGDSITYWQITNYGERDKSGDLSGKTQNTINCRTREIIMRYMYFYDDRNNNGKLTSSFAAKDSWTPIAPDSIRWDIMRFICK